MLFGSLFKCLTTGWSFFINLSISFAQKLIGLLFWLQGWWKRKTKRSNNFHKRLRFLFVRMWRIFGGWTDQDKKWVKNACWSNTGKKKEFKKLFNSILQFNIWVGEKMAKLVVALACLLPLITFWADVGEACKLTAKVRSLTKRPFKFQMMMPSIDMETEQVLFSYKGQQKQVTVSVLLRNLRCSNIEFWIIFYYRKFQP